MGLKEDGTVVAVGNNSFGQSNTSSWTRIKAIAVGDGHTVGLKEDGTVVGAGSKYFGQLNTSSWIGIKAVAAGGGHTVGLKEDGTVVAVGWNDYGQLNTSSWTGITAVAAGEYHTIGLKEDGTVLGVGYNESFLNISSWTGIKSIAAVGYQTVGLKEDGTVVNATPTWYPLQLNTSSWAGITAIAAGWGQIVGLKEDGTVMAVGWNGNGQLNWSNIRQPYCLDTVVEAPLSLTAFDAPCDNCGSIRLTWTLSPDDPSVGTGSNKVTGYNVYRSKTSGGPYSLIGSIAAGLSNFTDNSASNGITYNYTVKATDGTKESVDSNVASAASFRNLPLPPTYLTASDTPYDLGGSITLGWTKSADDGGGLNNVANYDIYRYSATDGNIKTLASLSAGTSGYVDSTTSDNETYFYYVKAYDGICSNGSDASNVMEGRSVNNFSSLPGFIGTLPGIAPQLRNSLITKAENALAAFERGNTTAAVKILNALLIEISAQTDKGIEPSTAQTLTTYVQTLIAYISAH